LSQGSLPATSHRSNNWLNNGVRKAFLPGCIFGIQSDQTEERRRRKDSLYHTIWRLFLPRHAFWPQERRSNLPKNDAKLPRKPNRLKYSSIHRQRSHHHKKRGVPNRWPERNLWQPRQVHAKIKSDQMFLWCFSRTTSGIPGIGKRNKGKSRVDSGNTNNGKTNKTAWGVATRRTHSSTNSIHRAIRQKGPPILRTHDKVE
jgi:hypothetical protein